jgi:3-carboxy-cis,cis-muconate cycloisomerase
MASQLIDACVTTNALAEAFSDEAVLAGMLEFEVALARAEAGAGVIPGTAADAIARAAASRDFPVEAISRDARRSASLAIPFVDALIERTASVDADAASYVHWGATSQDVVDTAIVLCVRRAWASIDGDHTRLTASLRQLAEAHADTVMLGRTLLQPAVPTTFGLKCAGWLAALSRCWKSWSQAFANLQVVQFGGAAGTLAALGTKGADVEEALAAELGLGVPDGPWHAHRDRIAAFVAASGVYASSAAKIARDVALLMQYEVGELFEAGGGSSAMPQKRNPSGCAVTIASANRLPALVAAVLSGGIHEHERGVGGWPGDAALVADALQAAGSAVNALAGVFQSISVDGERMRGNLAATHGVTTSEALAHLLRSRVGRERADALVKEALGLVASSGKPLATVAIDIPAIAEHLDPATKQALDDPSAYLGSAGRIRRRLLQSAAQ